VLANGRAVEHGIELSKEGFLGATVVKACLVR
jgi:hypothetical protein